MSKVVQNAAKNRKTTTKTVSVIKKPAVSKSTTNKPIKSKKSNQTKKTVNKDDSCIIYVGHIAHGFYEKEMSKRDKSPDEDFGGQGGGRDGDAQEFARARVGDVSAELRVAQQTPAAADAGTPAS